MRLNSFISSDHALVNIEFLDQSAIDSFYQQLESARTSVRKDTKFKLELSIPFFKAGLETVPPSFDTPFKKLIFVLQRLDDKGMVREGFPNNKMEPSSEKFYFSSGRAVKYIISKEFLTNVGLDEGIVIWLLRQDFEDENSKVEGNIMYLLQCQDPGQPYSARSSVYSATQFLLEEVGIIRVDRDPRDVPSYTDFRSAEMVLQTIGGKAQARRRIVSCYRCRSMSDNMYMEIGGVSKRFNDIVAYPIFIASL